MDHDTALFDALLQASRAIDPEVRAGRMFGCPAVYRGRKLAACVYGGVVALKVPADRAEAARASGRAKYFTPYGKSRMREWIEVDAGRDGLPAVSDLLHASIAYAREAAIG